MNNSIYKLYKSSQELKDETYKLSKSLNSFSNNIKDLINILSYIKKSLIDKKENLL